MKFLENEKNIFIMPVLYLIATAVLYFFILPGMSATFAIESIVEIITIVIMFVTILAYKKNENNMLKTLMGALLFERVFYSFGLLARYITEENTVIITVTSVLYLFFYIVFFFVHVSIDIKDTNASGKLAVNTVIGILIIVNNIIFTCSSTVATNGILSFIACILAEIFMVIDLLCLERKITY